MQTFRRGRIATFNWITTSKAPRLPPSFPRAVPSAAVPLSSSTRGSWAGRGMATAGQPPSTCVLTMSPVFSDQRPPTVSAYLYGSECDTLDCHMDNDLLCSFYRSTFSTTTMMPGTNVCTPGWHLPYNGFLMAFVDTRLQRRFSSDTNHNHKLLFYTATVWQFVL